MPVMRSGSPCPVSVADQSRISAMSSKACVRVFPVEKCDVAGVPDTSLEIALSHQTSRSGAAYGSGFSKTLFTTLKIAVVAPIPSASVTTAMAVKAASEATGGSRTECRGRYPR